jgi:hypothetical protein
MSDQCLACVAPEGNQELTNNQILENGNHIQLTLLVPTEEVITSAAAKLLHPALVPPPQLLVRWALLERKLLAEFCTPERYLIAIDGIVRATADQPVGCDILVRVELMSDGLVELSMLSEHTIAN